MCINVVNLVKANRERLGICFIDTAIALVLATYADKNGRNVYPSQSTIMKETGASESTVKRSYKRLRDGNILIEEQKASAKNHLAIKHRFNMSIFLPIHAPENKKATLTSRRHQVINSEAGVQQTPELVSNRPEAGVCETSKSSLETSLETSLSLKEISSNEPELGNPSSEQKSGSEVDRSAFRGKTILDETPTLENEQPSQEGKTVEPPTIPLKAEDEKAPKKSKGKGKVSKPKSNKVAKTPINPEMELTPELRNIALDVRVDGRGLKEGYVDSEFKIFRNKYVGNQRKEERWDLKWEEWCTKAIGWDEYSKKSMVNPSRATVSDKPAEEELPIDEKFKDFVAKYRDKDFYFRGAAFHEVRKDVLYIIQPHGEWRKDQLGRVDELKSWFKVKYVRVYAKVSDVPQPLNPNLLQAVVNTGESIELENSLQNIAKGIKGEQRGMKVVSSNPEKSIPVSNPLPKPPYNSVKHRQDSEVREKHIGSGKT